MLRSQCNIFSSNSAESKEKLREQSLNISLNIKSRNNDWNGISCQSGGLTSC